MARDFGRGFFWDSENHHIVGESEKEEITGMARDLGCGFFWDCENCHMLGEAE